MSDKTKSKRGVQDENGDDEQRFAKAKRHDIVPTDAEVDLKLAQKLDDILKLGTTRKPRFHTNRARQKVSDGSANGGGGDDDDGAVIKSKPAKSKNKNLSKKELRDRLLQKYDTLVPELDPKRPNVKVVKVLSAGDSVDLAKAHAQKQIENQLKLGSVAGNQKAHLEGIDSFHEAFEMSTEGFARRKSSLRNRSQTDDVDSLPECNNNSSSNKKTVRFSQKISVRFDPKDRVSGPKRVSISDDSDVSSGSYEERSSGL